MMLFQQAEEELSRVRTELDGVKSALAALSIALLEVQDRLLALEKVEPPAPVTEDQIAQVNQG